MDMEAQAPGQVVPTAVSSLPSEIPTVHVDAHPVVDSSSLSDDGDHLLQPADEDLRAKIIKQVEYYFSDENLPNDKFLMKRVKKDKGYVSISLIASFREMKRLAKETSVIIDALKESSQLVVSPDGKKVRRLHPLPSKETKASDSKSCTVLVENLPEDHSEENIRRIFGQVGSIKSISIYDPHAAEETTQINKAEKMMSGKLHALVRYETEETAEKAVATLNDETDWRNGLRVQFLQKRMGYGVGRKARKGADSDKAGHARVFGKEEDNDHSNAQHDDAPDEEVVSPDGKKVRRLHPLPSKETKASDSKSCTVIVENLPEDHSEENIRRIFGQVGSIKSISIYDPHAAEETTQINKAEKMMSGKLHALVRYETEETAEKAVATLNDETDWRNGLRVQFLQKRMGYGVGRKARKGADSDKAGHARVFGKEEDNDHSNAQHDDAPDEEEGVHVSKEGNGRKGRNRSKGRKYHGNNGMGHGAASIVEPSKAPPGPRMPDGTRGFVMGRGKPLVPSSA